MFTLHQMLIIISFIFVVEVGYEMQSYNKRQIIEYCSEIGLSRVDQI